MSEIKDDWYADRAELAAFAMALDDAGHFNETADVVRFIEKPWKWTAEYRRWVATNRPAGFEPEDES